MANDTVIVVRSSPGVKRDGTEFEGNAYVDSQWCRWQRGLPRKIGGCVSITSTFLEKIYGIGSYSQNAVLYQHLGSASLLTQVRLTAAGVLSGTGNRTPGGGLGFVASANNVWQSDVQFDFTGGALNFLFAHPGQNLAAIDSTVESPIFYDDVVGGGPLTHKLTDPQSGGVVVLAPYVLTYGNAGRIDIYKDPTIAPVNSANITGMKIVKGLPLRGTGTGAAGLFWSLDSLIRATFTSETTGYFAFDTVASTSVLSSRGIVEYDGIYYWAGVDRFLMFNGVVQELPNNMNVNYFFDNLDLAQRQKVFAFTIPRWGEIWWCYPRGNATECTHAVIYNVREKTWYDTQLLGLGRSDGIMPKTYNRPFTVDVTLTGTGYTMWQQETGVNEVLGSTPHPIQSWFETSDFTMLIGDKPVNKSLQVGWVEPDFVQIGDLILTVTGRLNARAPDVSSEGFAIPAVASTPQQEIIPLREVRRLMKFRFESNTIDGDYQTGQILAHVGPNDGRMVS